MIIVRTVVTCLLVCLVSLACEAADTQYRILIGDTVENHSAAEVREGISSGVYGDTSLIFDGTTWILFREHPETAKMLADLRAAVAATAAAPYLTVNAENPGQQVSLDSHLVAGKHVIFDFYSEYCPPCRAVAPLLEDLARKRSDVVVRKIDINRPMIRGIDWQSPVARQYNLQSIPHFIIYNPEGRKTAEGRAAGEIIERWISEIHK